MAGISAVIAETIGMPLGMRLHKLTEELTVNEQLLYDNLIINRDMYMNRDKHELTLT